MTTKKTDSQKTDSQKTVKDTGDDLIASPAEPITVDPANTAAYDSAPNAAPAMTSSTAYPEAVEVKKEAPKKRTNSSTSKKTSD